MVDKNGTNASACCAPRVRRAPLDARSCAPLADCQRDRSVVAADRDCERRDRQHSYCHERHEQYGAAAAAALDSCGRRCETHNRHFCCCCCCCPSDQLGISQDFVVTSTGSSSLSANGIRFSGPTVTVSSSTVTSQLDNGFAVSGSNSAQVSANNALSYSGSAINVDVRKRCNEPGVGHVADQHCCCCCCTRVCVCVCRM